jgi:hypothetical protein
MRIAVLSMLLGVAACSTPPHREEPAPVQVMLILPLARSLVSIDVPVGPDRRPLAAECPKRVFDVSSMRTFEVLC